MKYNIPKKPIIVGKIGGNYKNFELLKLFSFTEKKENILKYKPLYIKKKKWKIIIFKKYIIKKRKIIIKIKNINNRNKTKLLINKKIYIDFNILLNLNNQNYYWKNILGCKVINSNNYIIGKVKKILKTGSNDVLIIKKKFEIMIPFVKNYTIKKVDIKLKIIKLI
ncbi:ribosome maturation factor RimM [Enterobacterales bacterium endosymbiont of Anomoneura mori]|uniref:ribosome maturation factor RimM n=1 Tax=Enterobacterales bacterium endosymbiont of Anomoneura mori TaxID=3132096 RepID=UPI00399CC7F6